MVSLFDLSRTLPVGGGLLVPCSLPGPPVVKLWYLARVGSLSQCASPNISTFPHPFAMKTGCHNLSFLNVEFKASSPLSLSSFPLITKLFSSSLSAIRVVSAADLTVCVGRSVVSDSL